MKSALAIGINYVGTEYELRGCINDADDWAKLLGKHGFQVGLLPEKQATRANILHALQHLVSELKPGDVGCVTYSGHGTWVPDKDGDEPDGRDEAICPIDMGDGSNLILDDDLAKIFSAVSPAARIVLITDCCHSGSVFRFMPTPGVVRGRSRFLPPAHFMPDTQLQKIERAFGQPIRRTNAAVPGVIHFSACRDTEYANDALIQGRGCGAFTHFAAKAFEDTIAARGNYNDAFKLIRKSLPTWEFQQTPQFNCTTDNKKLLLLS